MRGEGRHSCRFSPRSRLRRAAVAATALTAAALLAACGGGSSDHEPAGEFEIEVTDASFPAEQRLGQTSLLTLSFRNEGEETVPNLVVDFSLTGEQGETAVLPFGVHERQAELANPTRPVWVLEENFPRLLRPGEGEAGLRDTGEKNPAVTSNPKTFAFGPLEAGETRSAVWKLSAVREGTYTLRYEVSAGLGPQAKAEAENGVPPGGTIVAEITAETPDTKVTEDGEIIELGAGG